MNRNNKIYKNLLSKIYGLEMSNKYNKTVINKSKKINNKINN